MTDEENRDKWLTDASWDTIETLVDVAERSDISPAAAINWLRAKPWVTAPIIGANRPEQLRETLSGLDTPLDPADVATLDEVSDFRRPRHVRED
ncbi:hypothetical protein BH23ACT10_BH23ACT10_12770 [soil metagenome]